VAAEQSSAVLTTLSMEHFAPQSTGMNRSHTARCTKENKQLMILF